MLIKQGKINIKYLFIAIILAAIVVGGVLWWQSCGCLKCCERYHYSTCPEGCIKKCVGSCPVCADCDGPRSCICPTAEELILQIDRDCTIDEDCKYTCGCGAINKNEICDEEGITYDCVDHEVKCANSRCVTGEEVIKDETAECLEKYPEVEYEDCIPGEVVDGWSGIILYPNTFDFSGIEHYIDAPAPNAVKDVGVARYGTSRSTCQTTWFIKINEEWKEVNQIEFCNHIIDYNSSCNDCLLEWKEGCC